MVLARTIGHRSRRVTRLIMAAAAALALGLLALVISLNAHAGVPLNCAASPHTCGYPDATNTGVQPGQTLVAVPAQKTSGPGWA